MLFLRAPASAFVRPLRARRYHPVARYDTRPLPQDVPMLSMLNAILFLVIVGWLLQWDGGVSRRDESRRDLELDPMDERERVRTLLRDLHPRPRRPRVRRGSL
jgi:hypothetical protein